MPTLLEVVAVVFSFAAVWLTIRKHVACWPVGLVGVTAYFLLFHRLRLYADMALQVVFFAQGLYGWWFWRRGGTDRREPPVTVLGLPRLAVLTAALLVATVGIGTLLARTDASAPYLDSFLALTSLTANALLARKVLESWWLWIIAGAIGTSFPRSCGRISCAASHCWDRNPPASPCSRNSSPSDFTRRGCRSTGGNTLRTWTACSRASSPPTSWRSRWSTHDASTPRRALPTACCSWTPTRLRPRSGASGTSGNARRSCGRAWIDRCWTSRSCSSPICRGRTTAHANSRNDARSTSTACATSSNVVAGITRSFGVAASSGWHRRSAPSSPAGRRCGRCLLPAGDASPGSAAAAPRRHRFGPAHL